MLRNLLARIHGDGGHYVEQHGLDKALEDADQLVAKWRVGAAERLIRLRGNAGNAAYESQCEEWLAALTHRQADTTGGASPSLLQDCLQCLEKSTEFRCGHPAYEHAASRLRAAITKAGQADTGSTT